MKGRVLSERTAHTNIRLIRTCSLFPLEIKVLILKTVLLTLQELSEILYWPEVLHYECIHRCRFVFCHTKSQGFSLFSNRREMMGVFRTSKLPRCLLCSITAAVCSAPPVPLWASRGPCPVLLSSLWHLQQLYFRISLARRRLWSITGKQRIVFFFVGVWKMVRFCFAECQFCVAFV